MAKAPAIRLHLLEGPAAGGVLQREGAQLTIGRTRTAKLQIKDPSVSEKHAEAIWSDGQWHLRDVGSSNGTLLNGARLAAGGEAPRGGGALACRLLKCCTTSRCAHDPLLHAGAPTPVKDGDTVCFGTVSVARLEASLAAVPGGSGWPLAAARLIAQVRHGVLMLQIASTEDANLTVQQFLQTECQQLEQRVRVRAFARQSRPVHRVRRPRHLVLDLPHLPCVQNHAGQLGDDLRKAWVAQKQLLMSGE
jgi:pSer/pThr/pTyr-binding forkhead associated (FHA) protein